MRARRQRRRPAVWWRSTVLDENRLEHVRSVLAGIDRFLELLVDVLPADERDRVDPHVEELCDRLARDAVALVFQLAQLDQLSLRVLEAFEHPDRLAELRCRAVDDVGLSTRGLADLARAVAGDLLRGVVDV